jgi:hypothetical protein
MNGPANMKEHPADRDREAVARTEATWGSEPVELFRELLSQSGVARRTS